jgi:hypothetical protein
MYDTKEFESEPEEDDLPDEITGSQLQRISLSGSDWTTETILNQMDRGNIDLSPRFQRRDAWQRDRKSRFIESLILNFPVPEIVLAERRERRGQFIVLDGKQRLTTLLQFTQKGVDESPMNGFTLTDLQVLKHLNRRNYVDMTVDDTLLRELDAFHNQTIRTVVIRNWDNDAVLQTIFVRLNTSSVPLSPQELRQALHPGPFSDFIDDRAVASEPLKLLLGLKRPDFRMRDVEILLRHTAFSFFLDKYSGNMSQFLNLTAASLNNSFSKRRADIEQAIDNFDLALEASITIFGLEHTARKWTGSEFESRWNRAILDVLLFYFSDQPTRAGALRQPEKVIAAYKEIFESNTGFRDAVEATTKSLSATYDRLSVWGQSLASALGITVPIPGWDAEKNRITRSGN